MKKGPLRFEIVSDFEKSKQVWEMFSPHKKIDDEWDFRFIWTEALTLPFHFIVGYDRETPIGLLPLQLNTLKGLGPKLLQMNEPYLEFFAGVDTDDNRVFLAPGYEDRVSDFLAQIKQPAVLTSLKEQYSRNGQESVFYLDRFEVDLHGITTFDEYIDRHMSGKTRRNVKHELRRSKLEDYKVDIVDGKKEDLDILFQLSIDRFGERSSFNREQRREVFRKFYERFDTDIFKVVLNGEVKAVVYAILYNKTYTGLNLGYDYSIPSFGKYLLTASVERAITKGCTLYDTGQGDNGYKSRLHITQIPQYKLVLNDTV